MTSDYYHKDFKCPFYEGNWVKELSCEVALLKFPDKIVAKEFMDLACASEEWGKCPIAQVLQKHYARVENEKRTKRNRRIKKTN